MMFLKYWKSPRTVLRKVFDYTDIPNLRIKFANDLMFVPGNNDMKSRVVEFVDPGHYLFIHFYMYIFYIIFFIITIFSFFHKKMQATE
jgi:hypothetical protein